MSLKQRLVIWGLNRLPMDVRLALLTVAVRRQLCGMSAPGQPASSVPILCLGGGEACCPFQRALQQALIPPEPVME